MECWGDAPNGGEARSLKLRWLIVVFFLFCLTAGGIYKIWSLVTQASLDELKTQGNTTLSLAVSALGGHLSRYESLPALVADHENIKKLVRDPDNPRLRAQMNIYLKSINALLKSSDIYIMTLDGMTISASNYDGPTSFIGQNFNYRPYFLEAIRGLNSRFFALGTTSFKRGYYFSAPIFDHDLIKGVIVFKVDIEGFEASFGGDGNRILVSDPEGIIFMATSQDWLYSSLTPLTDERLSRTYQTRRYANAVLTEIPAKLGMVGNHETIRVHLNDVEHEYIVLSKAMPEAGWTISVLIDTASLRNQITTTMLAVILCFCLTLVLLGSMYQRRKRLRERIELQSETQAELERRVEERTTDLAKMNTEIKREVSVRRAAEKKLRKTQNDLVQAGKLAALGQMSAALSHEFNQPLSAVKTYADSANLLIERGRVDEAQDNLKRIAGLIDRMATISKHLRNFARKPNEIMTPVLLEAVVNEALEIVSSRLKIANVHLKIQLGSKPIYIKAGSVRLQQVLVNVLSNAVDALEAVDDKQIDLTASIRKNKAQITISDNGAGIPPATIDRIFDPFFTTKVVGRGLGLGLSISYNIIKDFGGKLIARNKAEGGAEFIIELNLAEGLSGVGAK